MNLKDIFQVGKEGLSHNIIKGIRDAIEAHELVKISVLKTVETPIKEIALDIASQTNSQLVQIIGRNIVLYRASKKRIIKF